MQQTLESSKDTLNNFYISKYLFITHREHLTVSFRVATSGILRNFYRFSDLPLCNKHWNNVKTLWVIFTFLNISQAPWMFNHRFEWNDINVFRSSSLKKIDTPKIRRNIRSSYNSRTVKVEGFFFFRKQTFPRLTDIQIIPNKHKISRVYLNYFARITIIDFTSTTRYYSIMTL